MAKIDPYHVMWEKCADAQALFSSTIKQTKLKTMIEIQQQKSEKKQIVMVVQRRCLGISFSWCFLLVSLIFSVLHSLAHLTGFKNVLYENDRFLCYPHLHISVQYDVQYNNFVCYRVLARRDRDETKRNSETEEQLLLLLLLIFVESVMAVDGFSPLYNYYFLFLCQHRRFSSLSLSHLSC